MLTTVGLIQEMLAPGVMINACGLLLLGINNKYSIIVGRIRALEEEKRRMLLKGTDQGRNDFEQRRWRSIEEQLSFFAKRIRFVRNCVALYASAIALFLLTSFSIVSKVFFVDANIWPSTIAMLFFILGMTFVLVGVIYAVGEVLLGYRVVKVELNELLDYRAED